MASSEIWLVYESIPIPKGCPSSRTPIAMGIASVAGHRAMCRACDEVMGYRRLHTVGGNHICRTRSGHAVSPGRAPFRNSGLLMQVHRAATTLAAHATARGLTSGGAQIESLRMRSMAQG
jgi:hypothetical protein